MVHSLFEKGKCVPHYQNLQIYFRRVTTKNCLTMNDLIAIGKEKNTLTHFIETYSLMYGIMFCWMKTVWDIRWIESKVKTTK